MEISVSAVCYKVGTWFRHTLTHAQTHAHKLTRVHRVTHVLSHTHIYMYVCTYVCAQTLHFTFAYSKQLSSSEYTILFGCIKMQMSSINL